MILINYIEMSSLYEAKKWPELYKIVWISFGNCSSLN